MTVNNDIFQAPGLLTGIPRAGVVSSGSSTISRSAFHGFVILDINSVGIQIGGNAIVSQCNISGNGGGIAITSGSPVISGNTIDNNNIGAGNIGISVSGGNPVITGNVISNNGEGIEMNAGSAVISANNISGNSSAGILLFGITSAPTATISGNTSNHNGYGINAQSAAGSSIHTNSLFCNSIADFYLGDVAAPSPFDISNNTWGGLVSGPTISTGCTAGIGICYNAAISIPPNFSPFSSISSGCPN